MKDPKDNKTIDAFKPVPMTGAERQRKYRENLLLSLNPPVRLDIYISHYADSQIKIICECLGMTKSEAIEAALSAFARKEQERKIKQDEIDAFARDFLSDSQVSSPSGKP